MKKEKEPALTSSTREKMVRLLKEKPLIKNSDVREALSFDLEHAAEAINALVDEGYLIKDHVTKQAAFFRKNKP